MERNANKNIFKRAGDDNHDDGKKKMEGLVGFFVVAFILAAVYGMKLRGLRRHRRLVNAELASAQREEREEKQKKATKNALIRQHLTVKIWATPKGETNEEEGDIESQKTEEDPRTVYRESKECSICLTDFEEGSLVCVSNNSSCQHVFDKECMVTWLMKNKGCPCCRADFLMLEEKDESSV